MRAFLLGGGIAVWLVCAALRWASPTPLGHDEARYATAASDLLAGEPARWLYVPVGMEVIAAPGVLAGGSDRALRLVPMLLGLAFLAAAWRVGCAIGDRDTGAATVAVLAGSTNLARFQIDLLSDLPAAACLILALSILIDELPRRAAPRRRILWVAPACAAALYVRYGSCLAIALLAVVMLLFRGRRVVLTGALFALLVVPHALHAVARTGSPLGILRESAGVPPSGGGLAGYLGHPFVHFGALPPLFVAAIALAYRDRRRVLAVAVGVADIVVLGVFTAAQTRYVALGIVLLIAAGVAVVPRRVLVVPVVLAWIVSLVHARISGELRIAGMRQTLVAAPLIAADARGRPCEVIGRHAMQIRWYSGCTARHPARRLVYTVRDDTGGPGQPQELPGTRVVDRPGVLEIARLAPP